jgi:DNA repair exonuclease SbcCD ATPase subunit
MNEAYQHRQNLEALQSEEKREQTETNPIQEQIDELQQKNIEVIDYATINSLTSLKEHQEFLYRLLTSKDSFIRKKIIDQNLNYLNSRLNHYLDTVGLPHEVVFQSDLTVMITELGRELDFDNLSRGERNRLILGLSWAFRDVFETTSNQLNLLFIDELIDSGMDTQGVESAIAVLKKMGRERNKNVFLISHRDELIGRVTNILNVIKEHGFTTFDNDLELVGNV